MKTIGETISKLVRMNRARGQKGIAIYLAAITMSIVLTAAFGTSLIILYQLKNINEAGSSVIAFSAAETGIEWALTYLTAENYNTTYSAECSNAVVELNNGAAYNIECSLCGGDANGDGVDDFLCIRSEGQYRGTQRTIKIQR